MALFDDKKLRAAIAAARKIFHCLGGLEVVMRGFGCVGAAIGDLLEAAEHGLRRLKCHPRETRR